MLRRTLAVIGTILPGHGSAIWHSLSAEVVLSSLSLIIYCQGVRHDQAIRLGVY
jgi:hypothetical protein